MRKRFDPTVKYGRLTIIGKVSGGDGYDWLCRCDCGKEKIISQRDLIGNKTKSCGCLRREKAGEIGKITIVEAVKAAAIAHTKHGGRKERLYGVWRSMINRCRYIGRRDARYYGDRGIKVCKEWQESYEAFRDWAMSNGYDAIARRGDCTIDRIDVNGNYEPNNCRWVDMKVQASNKRNSGHRQLR